MSLKISILASGSKGNCTYISDGKTRLLVDLGLYPTDLKLRAQEAGVDLSGINAVINTHCHTDHCKGIRAFVNRYDVPVYSHVDGKYALLSATKMPEKNLNVFNGDFNIGDIYITPITLSHDAPHCSGFSFASGESRISMATDLGTIGEEVLSVIYGSSLAVIESNHDTDMLKMGRYPQFLKNRISSGKGHLSNNDCCGAIKKLLDKGTKNFFLAHLSEENNLPELAFSSLTDYLNMYGIKEGRDYSAEIAFQRKVSKTVNI